MGILGKLSPAAIKETLQRWRRTIEITRKPDREEWLTTAKVTGIGIILLGTIGFIMFLIYRLIITALGGVA